MFSANFALPNTPGPASAEMAEDEKKKREHFSRLKTKKSSAPAPSPLLVQRTQEELDLQKQNAQSLSNLSLAMGDFAASKKRKMKHDVLVAAANFGNKAAQDHFKNASLSDLMSD